MLATVAGLSTASRGVQFAGGTGEPNNPYQIATADQLIGIWSPQEPELLQKHFVLTASINLAGRTWSDSVISFFQGVFDGNGWTVRNLRIEGGDSQGLFGIVWPGAEIRNLGIENVHIAWGQMGGALARINGGRLVNCYSTGTINTALAAGGLVAWNEGTMINCYSTATVGGAISVGGLAGRNMGSISHCHATGDVIGDSDVGGLVGNSMGRISFSYSTGAVTATLHAAGGLVGTNASLITSCYADAAVECYDLYAGGLVGHNMGSIVSCYSGGTVSGEDRVGGLAGSNSAGLSKISMSYSVTEMTARSYSWFVGGLVGSGGADDNCYFLDEADGGGPDNQAGTPLRKNQLKQQSSFVGWDFWGTASDGQSDLWFMPQNACPVLAWQTEITGLSWIPDVTGLRIEPATASLTAAGFELGSIRYDVSLAAPAGCVIRTDPYGLMPVGATVDLVVSADTSYAWSENPGDGTSANPYRIETAGQLDSLAANPSLWSRHFVLSTDLDMMGRKYSTALIAPDTDRSADGFQGTPFRGTFDGNGHAIRNLTIQRVDVRHNYVGLFGMIAQGGSVQNLSILAADVEGGSGTSSYVGVLAGYNAGTVSGCTVAGVIRGGKGDGLVGFNAGVVTNCHTDVARR